MTRVPSGPVVTVSSPPTACAQVRIELRPTPAGRGSSAQGWKPAPSSTTATSSRPRPAGRLDPSALDDRERRPSRARCHPG